MSDIQFTSHADDVKRAKDEAIERALEAIGIQAEGDVAMLTPVDTGRLRASITHDTRPEEESVYIGSNVFYSSYVEYGTSKAKAQPYLRPGIENNIDTYKSIAEGYLKG